VAVAVQHLRGGLAGNRDHLAFGAAGSRGGLAIGRDSPRPATELAGGRTCRRRPDACRVVISADRRRMSTVELDPGAASSTYPPERRRQPRLGGPPRVYLEMAKWLLDQETNDAGGEVSVPEAAAQACQKLLDRLAKVITPSGCHALLTRALSLARTDFRFLRDIRPDRTAGTYLDGLQARAEGTDPGQVYRGLASLLGTLIELVALFIGDYLTGHLLREIWPNVPVLDVPQPVRPVE
jgi:hypothetical protein